MNLGSWVGVLMRDAQQFSSLGYGDYLISYCHLSKILVSKGTRINAGEAIGVSGNSGRSMGPHLHLTCKRDGQTIDPAIVLNYISEIRSSVIQQLASIALLMLLIVIRSHIRREYLSTTEKPNYKKRPENRNNKHDDTSPVKRLPPSTL